MRFLKKILVVILSIIGILGLAFIWLVNSHPDMSRFDSFYAKPAMSDVTVQFFGTSSMMFSDGTTNIMIDGWFTRPSTMAIGFGTIAPDNAAITHGLTKLGSPDVAAIIPAHSHFDHAMDVAEVAKRTGAMVVGSEATANIARGGGLPEAQIAIAADGESFEYGAFKIKLIETLHFAPDNAAFTEAALKNPDITAPLVPPVAALDYKLGKAYTVLIEHPGGSALIQASANQKAGSLDGIKADVVYLGVGGVGGQTSAYRDAYWQEIVTKTAAKGIYIIHWDSFSVPLQSLRNRPASPDRLVDSLLLRASDGIQFALSRAEQSGIASALLPLWDKADAFSVARQ